MTYVAHFMATVLAAAFLIAAASQANAEPQCPEGYKRCGASSQLCCPE